MPRPWHLINDNVYDGSMMLRVRMLEETGYFVAAFSYPKWLRLPVTKQAQYIENITEGRDFSFHDVFQTRRQKPVAKEEDHRHDPGSKKRYRDESWDGNQRHKGNRGLDPYASYSLKGKGDEWFEKNYESGKQQQDVHPAQYEAQPEWFEEQKPNMLPSKALLKGSKNNYGWKKGFGKGKGWSKGKKGGKGKIFSGGKGHVEQSNQDWNALYGEEGQGEEYQDGEWNEEWGEGEGYEQVQENLDGEDVDGVAI